MADKTWFDYFVSCVALVTGAYTFYKNFIERAAVSILPGDRMAVVHGPGGARRIHLRCTLVNSGTKIGTLEHLEANITGPDSGVQRFIWNEFFKFVPGSMQIESAGLPLPISIPGKSSTLLLCQLELTEPSVAAKWTAGRHQVDVVGWVNRGKRVLSANARGVFHFHVSKELAEALPKDQPRYAFEDVMIEEWSA